MARTPDSIGKYKVIDQLAQGGMGAVYSATHPTLERTVIIKKLTLRGNTNVRERFRREAQIMMDLRNDAIVDVYDHFREGSSYYIVLEYVDGYSLEGLIERERYLSERIALTILREACRALAYAHEHKVVHRDIKPANILISNSGEVKLVDFGIATIHGDDASDLTQEGTTLGTPSYMAPEQFHSSRGVDYRADIYSLGVVLYEMSTGKRPYPGSFSPEVLGKIQKGKFENPRSVNPKVTRYVARLIRKLMQPKPKRRVQNLDKLVAKLDRRLGIRGRTGATAILRPYLAGESRGGRRPGTRRRKAVAFTAMVALVLGAGYWAYAKGYHLELFQPHVYGAAEVTVRVPEGSKPPGELYLAGAIFVDDNENIPVFPGGTLRFSRVPEEEGPGEYLFRSQRLQLPAGEYRAKIEAENRLAWHAFSVQALARESRSPIVIPGRREDAAQVVATFNGPGPLPLEVSYTVRAGDTGERLAGATLLLRTGGRWRPWNRLIAASMRSDNVYRFRFTHPDYEWEEYSLSVEPLQTSLHMEVILNPRE